MIEPNNPEINVDDLMQKVRDEVARHNHPSHSVEENSNGVNAMSVLNTSNIEALINDAEFNSQASTKWPDKLNRFPFNLSKRLQRFILKLYRVLFKKQRVVNFDLSQALRESLALNRELVEQVSTLQAQLQEMNDRLTATEEKVTGINTVMEEQVNGSGDRLTAIEEKVSGVDARLTTTEEQVTRVGDRLTNTSEQVAGIRDQLTATKEKITGNSNHCTAIDEQVSELGDRLTTTQKQVDGIGNHLRATDEQVSELGDRLTTTQKQVDGLGNHLRASDERFSGIGVRLTSIQEQANGLGSRLRTTDERVSEIGDHVTATDERISEISNRLKATDERQLRDNSYFKNDLAQQKRLINIFLEEARQRLPEPFSQEQLQTFVNEEQHLLDPFYAAFEERFRGSREEILNKLKVYLPLLEEAKVGTPEYPVLDVGCGRGEWLELLRKSGYTARGVDSNWIQVDFCEARGLEVVEGDVVSYLQNLPDLSLGIVSGFHLIEHLPFPVLTKFLNEAVRVLKPGGLAIFETPNPKNIVVSACNFYSDPTHLNPVFPETIQFLLEFQGLSQVQLMYLNPVEDSPFNKNKERWQLLHNWFFGHRDYAVIGRKV